MAKVVSFINMKGGVGKTTLAVNVAHALAAIHEKRVLVVDIDPQFNASSYLLEPKRYIDHMKKKHCVLDIFTEGQSSQISSVTGAAVKDERGVLSLKSCTVTVAKTRTGVLDLIPSHLDLMSLENSQRGTERKLLNFLQKATNAYDYILLDCPPTISFFTTAAMLASDSYLVPVKPDDLSVIGLPLLEKWLGDATRNAGKSLTPVGVVFCMVRDPHPNHMKRVMKDLRHQRGTQVFDSQLSQSAKVAESVEAHKAIFQHAPASRYAKQVKSIAAEFLARTADDDNA